MEKFMVSMARCSLHRAEIFFCILIEGLGRSLGPVAPKALANRPPMVIGLDGVLGGDLISVSYKLAGGMGRAAQMTL